MIKVVKPIDVPKILTTKGKTLDTKNRENYDANPQVKIKIENSIYGHISIKKVLKKAQHNKCCFCEKSQVDENGAVEHFRPKGGYHSIKTAKLERPGYYWLGYDWNNLYFVCSGCNSRLYKGNLFPLKDESKRAKSHHHDINQETPLLISPGDNPREHIVFDDKRLPQIPKGKTIFGKKTIEICGIDRDALNDMRKELINTIDDKIAILFNKVHHDKRTVTKARQFIKNSQKPEAEFSATAIDYLKNFNIVEV